MQEHRCRYCSEAVGNKPITHLRNKHGFTSRNIRCGGWKPVCAKCGTKFGKYDDVFLNTEDYLAHLPQCDPELDAAARASVGIAR